MTHRDDFLLEFELNSHTENSGKKLLIVAMHEITYLGGVQRLMVVEEYLSIGTGSSVVITR